MKRTGSMIYKKTDEARELYLFADNCGRIYEACFLPILENLKKHYKKGVYSHEKAVDALYRYMTIASDTYKKMYGYSFTVQDRFTASVDFERMIYEEYIEN